MENVNTVVKITGSRRFKMDANKFMTEYRRLCSTYQGCIDCPLSSDRPCAEIPARYRESFSSKLIKAVEDWSASHPVTTRADIFKKLYPDAALDGYGSLAICPFELNKNFMCLPDTDCVDCRKKYWSKEVQP